jgi:hypothetical protein
MGLVATPTAVLDLPPLKGPMLLHLTCLNVLFISAESALLCAFAKVANNNKKKLWINNFIIIEIFNKM